MPATVLTNLLRKPLPVLFVYIGWAERYDGSEVIVGTHAYLKEHPRKAGEAFAFALRDGLFRCGIGRGALPDSPIHIAFVARDPLHRARRIVGVYAAANPNRRVTSTNWWDAETRSAFLLPVSHRPQISDADWRGDTGMRRWARREASESSESGLMRAFRAVLRQIARPQASTGPTPLTDQTYPDLDAIEGSLRLALSRHRSRETRLRRAKLNQALDASGTLLCEVPGCGFDFERRYGRLLGYGFAHVHHLRPLREAPTAGRRASLSDLAIVCANCHAMIHRGGQSRPLKTLIPR